ncbi:aminopeptidase [Lactobacillus nasalidis]|uniref:Aminopeptidase n=1 Tax=Lactobacillus nasalidis TaxID=2797258 RepID=A0ABQ3W3M1_9LACO|nr:aminopeptidase [Lactobacillus nasalidis]
MPRAYQPASKNNLTDVPGVKVGQVTLRTGGINTGVTAIIPGENIFKEKMLASGQVINGFGKTTGLVQVNELGSLETPILMTNTLAVGSCWTALTRYMLASNPEIGLTTGTVNPVVMECNDGDLNDIRALAVSEDAALEALKLAESGPELAEGNVGAGTGMRCLGFKGGIGSSSRLVAFQGQNYHVGSLVCANFGAFGKLRAGGRLLGLELKDAVLARAKREGNRLYGRYQKDQGSIVMVLATDLPLSSRQLGRLARRSAVGLARTGSYIGDGSGDIALAFSTANRLDHFARQVQAFSFLPDSQLDPVFEAGADAIEEAVLSALVHAATLTGFKGRTVYGLRDFL